MHIFAKFHVSNYFLPKGTRWLLVNVHPRMFAYPGRKWKIAEKKQKIKKHYFFWNHPLYGFFLPKKSKKWTNKMSIFEVFSKNFIICPYLSISWKNTIFFEITPYMKIFCQKKAKNGQIKCSYLKCFPKISLSAPIWAFPEKTIFFVKSPPIWTFFSKKKAKNDENGHFFIIFRFF